MFVDLLKLRRGGGLTRGGVFCQLLRQLDRSGGLFRQLTG